VFDEPEPDAPADDGKPTDDEDKDPVPDPFVS